LWRIVVPLIKSGTRNAVSSNIREMVASGHPRAQAVAAALNTARKYGKAGGGALRWAAEAMAPPAPPKPKRVRKIVLDSALREAKKFASGGALDKTGLGDPANHVPFPAGMLNSSIPGRTDKLPISVKAGSYVIPADIVAGLGDSNSAAGRKVLDRLISSYTAGAAAPDLAAPGADIPIVAAGREYVVHPVAVRAIGGGDLEKGHNQLDTFVKEIRKRHIKTLRGLPGPKTD
jgi:hypothetical protein